MKGRHGGLGRGLDSFLPAETAASVREAPVGDIRQNPRQPRTSFDEAAIEELAASIREHGIIQPLIVSERTGGGYELIAGERRWRAAQRAGLQRVPVIVRETTPQQLLELALIENVQRADLNPLEEAHAYQALKDEFGLSDDQIAKRVGKNNRVTITNTRRLLKLPAEAQAAITANRISAGHGRALLKLEQPEQQVAALELLLEHELSVREAERLCELGAQLGDVRGAGAQIRGAPLVAPAPPRTAARQSERQPHMAEESADDREIGRELERILATPVALHRSGRELRVTITFYDDEQLQSFFDRLSGG